MTKKFIKPLYDTTIKYLVKSTDTMYIIYKFIYLATGIDLSDYTLIDQELNTGNNIKDYRLDLLFKKDNTIINLEVNYEVTKWTRRKQYNYLFRLAGSGYDVGDSYKSKKVVQITLNNSYFEKKDAKLVTYCFRDSVYHTKIDDVESYEIYLSNFKGIKYNGKNQLATLCSILTSESMEQLKEIVGNYKEGLILMSELEKLKLNDEFNAYYDYEAVIRKEKNSEYASGRDDGLAEGKTLGLAEGKSLGLSEGANKEKLAIAKIMLQGKESLDKIMKYTGLSKKELTMLL
ncbi:MAG: hypothetical protein LKJ84_02525 [Bacilli bacterium]|jgi:hypothetical protein|nr:hypothetical protein [Bacilli bacterium]